MKYNLTRRRFLQTAALGSLALPALLRRSAFAQDGSPLRVVCLVSRNGQVDSLFYPNITKEQSTPVGNGLQIHTHRLSDIAGDISPIFHSDFDDIRDKMSIIRGLDGTTTAGHNRCAPLCGSSVAGGGSVYTDPSFKHSIDAVIADNIYIDEPVNRALRLSASFNARDYDNSWSWNGSHLPVQGDLVSVFNSLFANVDPGDAGIDPAIILNSGVIDHLNNQFKANPKEHMGMVGKMRVEQYFEQLRRAQNSVEQVRAVCETPILNGVVDENRMSNEIVYDAAFDIISGAFACDLTRVAVVDMDHATDQILSDSGWHASSHYPQIENFDNSLPFNAFLGSRVAGFLKQLDSLIDVDGNTVLDNTIVLWTNEIAWGNSHSPNGMPIMMAGGGSKFVNGEYIDYRQHGDGTIRHGNLSTKIVGVPYSRLLISIMDAMGITPAQYQFGTGGFGDYDVQGGLDTYYNGMFADKNAKLPYFYKTI